MNDKEAERLVDEAVRIFGPVYDVSYGYVGPGRFEVIRRRVGEGGSRKDDEQDG